MGMSKTQTMSRREAITCVGAAGLSVPSLLQAQEYSAPGIYVEEIPSGAPAIQGVETSTAAFVGVASGERPTNEIVSISSLVEAQRYIGGRDEKLFPTFQMAIRSFFANGGARALIVNAAHEGGAYEDEGVPLLPEALDALGEANDAQFNLLYLPTAEKYFGGSMLDLSALYEHALNTIRPRGAMLVIDGVENPEEVRTWRTDLGLDDPDVAAFAPRLVAHDCQRQSYGAGGAVAGVIARTDQNRGVWKAPAGLEASIRGSTAQIQYSEADLNTLGQNNINPIRVMPSSGAPIVWGSRTMSSDPEWKYIAVRRYFRYLEASIEKGIDWTVFEPNNATVWSAAKAMVDAFMQNQFRAGALAGTRTSEAYFVRCGLGETMTQSDIDNGKLIIEVGFAPLRPAEFIIFRITKKIVA